MSDQDAINNLLRAAQEIKDSFRATHADASGLVHWEVSPDAMKHLIVALHEIDRSPIDTKANQERR